MNHLKYIFSEIKDDIGIIRINNPPGNFLVTPEFIPLNLLVDWIEDNKLKGILICGMGKHFSGGAQLKEMFTMAENSKVMAKEIAQGKNLLDYIENLTIPVVAAIQGTCFGGGLEIALACHQRICSQNAIFAFPEINHGLMPGLGGIISVARKISFYESMKLILGGDMLNAEEALSMKIIDKILPNNEVFEYSFSLLKRMTADRELKVIRFVMEALHNSGRLSKEDALKEETRMFCELAVDEVRRRRAVRNEE
jgi:enoyl-CoA hydratase